MAPHKVSFTQERNEAGSRLLSFLDEAGLHPVAAAWMLTEDRTGWVYAVSTPMLSRKGPQWIYQRLAQLYLKGLIPESVSPLDIYLIDESLEYKLFGSPLMTVGEFGSQNDPPIVMVESLVNGTFAGNGYLVLYRRLAATDRSRRRDYSMQFDSQVRSLAA